MAPLLLFLLFALVLSGVGLAVEIIRLVVRAGEGGVGLTAAS